MTCPFCRAAVTDNASYCSSCGRGLGPTAASSSRSEPVAGDVLKSSASSASLEAKVLGAATLVVFIGLLLPWYSVNFFGVSASVNGFAGWGWLTVAAMLMAVVVTIVMLGVGRFAVGRERHLRITALVAGVLEVVGAVAFWVDASGSIGVFDSPSPGLFLALTAGLVTAGAAALSLTRPRWAAAGLPRR